VQPNTQGGHKDNLNGFRCGICMIASDFLSNHLENRRRPFGCSNGTLDLYINVTTSQLAVAEIQLVTTKRP
jgi:hypothetical protein